MVSHWAKGTAKAPNEDTAVVAALSFWDYSLVANVQGSETYKATGRCFSVAAGRISYTFALKGAQILSFACCLHHCGCQIIIKLATHLLLDMHCN